MEENVKKPQTLTDKAMEVQAWYVKNSDTVEAKGGFAVAADLLRLAGDAVHDCTVLELSSGAARNAAVAQALGTLKALENISQNSKLYLVPQQIGELKTALEAENDKK